MVYNKNYESGKVSNEGNGMIGGKYWFASADVFLKERDMDITFNGNDYYVMFNIGFYVEEGEDESVNSYTQKVTCDPDSVEILSVDLYKGKDTVEINDNELINQIKDFMTANLFMKKLEDFFRDEVWEEFCNEEI